MEEQKCFCHFNGYEVKDAKARNDIELARNAIEVNKQEIENILNEKEFISIKHLGAVGDGETDDTLVFQNALNTYKNIFIDEGTYKITDTLNLTGGHIIVGASRTRSILKLFSEDKDLFKITGYHNILKHIQLTSNDLENANGIHDTGTYMSIYDNVDINKFTNAILILNGCMFDILNSNITNNINGIMFEVPEGTEDARSINNTTITINKTIINLNTLGIGSQKDSNNNYPGLINLKIQDCDFEANVKAFDIRNNYLTTINNNWFERNENAPTMLQMQSIITNNRYNSDDQKIEYVSHTGYPWGFGGNVEISENTINTKNIKLQNFQNSNLTNNGKITISEISTNANTSNRTPLDMRSLSFKSEGDELVRVVPFSYGTYDKSQVLMFDLIISANGGTYYSNVPEVLISSITKTATGKYNIKFNAAFDICGVYASAYNQSTTDTNGYYVGTNLSFDTYPDGYNLYKTFRDLKLSVYKAGTNELSDGVVAIKMFVTKYYELL